MKTKRRTKKNWKELKRTKAIKIVLFERYLKTKKNQQELKKDFSDFSSYRFSLVFFIMSQT